MKGASGGGMMEKGCVSCSFRALYEKNPRSLLGRIWRWHINFCPGWREYLQSLPLDEKKEIISHYHLKEEKFLH